MAAVASPAETNVVVLHRVSWRTYESLLEDFADRGSPRLIYDRGTLEIMSPTQRHEKLNRILALLVDTACEELGMDIESLGSTTFRRRKLDRGFEPDSCFYFAKAELVRSKERLDLSVDPPPELVIEIDITTSSVPKDEIYASLGVLEVWRYDGNALRIGRLQGKKYMESKASAVIPILTAHALSQFVEMSKTTTRPKLLRAFRDWLGSRR